jgi:tetratricopeptide (TPR) repeat protein
MEDLMRVFVSHCSQDIEAVEALAAALRDRGFETWLDRWEIRSGDDLVARINAGLDAADAGLIVYSSVTAGSRWVAAESSYLIWAAIEEGKLLIPVMLDADAPVPPLVRPRLRRGIDEIDAIAEALRDRRAGPPPVRPASEGRTRQVTVALERTGEDGGVAVEVRLGDEVFGAASFDALPADVVRGHQRFLLGFRAGVRREPAAAERAGREAEVAELGRALRPLCLPGGAAAAVAELLDGAPAGVTVEVSFESADPELLGLPFEALRLEDDRLLSVHPKVATVRRPAGRTSAAAARLAGPLKVLVAVGAPDAGRTTTVVLDQERELQNILDAVDEARALESVEVRILEVGSPKEIGRAIERDGYHVLHLSCHGGPGVLELEDEDGGAVQVTADELLQPIQRHGRPLPLVFLNACHGGVRAGETASLAEELLAAGVPAVLAMQTSVSDHYASLLAGRFYGHLARRDAPRASRALAAARQELEDERRKALRQAAADPGKTQPEAATPTLYLAGAETALMDPSLDREPLRSRPVYELAGPVPQLRIDDLIGRRKELRTTLGTLRDSARRVAGVALTGIGGVGKSAVAGRAMQRLKEDGWLVPAHHGRFDLARIAAAVGQELLLSGREDLQPLAGALLSPQLADVQRFLVVAKALAEHRVLLVLDDFEQNLGPGGGAFLDADTATFLGLLVQNARRGRLLITCRYPVPGFEDVLEPVALGPLSDAESRKLLMRLESLRERPPAELRRVLRVIGGHPRMLELLDALLRGGEGRLTAVTTKLRELLAGMDEDVDGAVADLDEGLRQTVLLGTRDVMLGELLAVARAEGCEEALLQVAVSNLPVSAGGLARMLADDPADPGDVAAVERAMDGLARLSLVFRLPDGTGWVHRWTAEGLADLSGEDDYRRRCNRAGRYRWWRVANESHDLEDAVEAVRNHLAGRDFDAATGVAEACFDALRRFQRTAGIASLASEVLETLPVDHGGYGFIADQEGDAHLALGWTGRAMERYQALLALYQRRVEAEPDRADFQRDLSVWYNKMGDLYRALGQGEKARDAFQSSLTIRERLAEAEPDRADFQRDLSVSYNKMGDLYRALGQGEKARDAFQSSLTIAKRLAEAEPDRADFQRDLSVSYERMGDLYRALGQGEKAREAFQSSLTIRERLAEAEPDRADFQVDLASSLVKVGLEGIGGRANFERALSILETLKSQGRLSPADEPKIEALRSLLDRLDNPDGVGSGSPG